MVTQKFNVEVPSEAVAFLGAVAAFLLILIIFFLYLNKLLCFSSCGGFPCIDGPTKKKEPKSSKLGTAYAYEDETSSDSDAEVLKRFKTSIQRSSSRYSQKGSPTRRPSTKSPLSSPLSSEKSLMNQNNSATRSQEQLESQSINEMKPGPKVEKLIDMDSPEHRPPSAEGSDKGANGGGLTPGEHHGFDTTPLASSVTTGSAHTLEGTQTYNNQAFDKNSVSGTEVDDGNLPKEHMFDVSDLQQEPPLISKCGSLEVTFTYIARKSRMEVTIHQAQEIPAKERGGANNTQVRLLLLPTKKQRNKTKVKQGDNPEFEETFVFNKISEEEVGGFGLRFRLYGVERMRRERMIGESIIGFASLNIAEPSTHWVILEPRSNLSQGDSNADVASLSRSDSASSTQSLQHGGMPELLLGLAYNGTTGRLSTEVIKGSNFRNMAMNRAPDTYVKLTLMAPNGTEVAHSKTSVRRGQPNPLFKEKFMFQVALFQLAETTLMVSVYHKKSMKKKEMIGWFSLGLTSSGEEESSHWQDMRESKGENICRWHVLLES